ncbi:fimbrial chaperone [Enterobacter hormaechei]|uniref:Molecular chaperone n=1 Tax=Phytobacter ursingii TaxID=1972431 RepID=A0AB35RW76_9ENTR|nr:MULTISPECIES: molecular chaperone [Enterobacteriaceae]MDV2865702.1 molecular chaperone [Phytobacter ursingii]GJL34465.1 fimbrial chaperone [Enterobacter hormaechei]
MFRRAVCFFCFSVILLTSVSVAYAGITLNATRVIYPEGKNEATLGIKNDSSAPRLIQTWVNAGEGNNVTPPFIIMPPIFRVDSGKGQSLRIHFTGGDIPRDRESVFWINVLEVSPTPPGKKAGTQNVMQFPVRSRLKLFYRPKDLPGSPKEAVSTLQWRLLPGKEGVQLECTNPSAFNVSFHDIRLTQPSDIDKTKKSGMCPAKGRVIFKLSNTGRLTQGTVFFAVIDDNGSFEMHEAHYRN